MNLETMTATEMASLLKITPASLRCRLCRKPESLPTPVQQGKGARLLWLKEDVEVWLKAGKLH